MEPPSSYSIQIRNSSGKRIPTQPIKAGIEKALLRHQMPAGIVSVLLCSDSEMMELNQQFRGVSQSTDVLTFPSDPQIGAKKPVIGDIAICVDFASRQADYFSRSLQDELVYLAIHGVLHLAGFDDVEDQDRKDMIREMHAIGSQLGLPIESDWESMPYHAGEVRS